MEECSGNTQPRCCVARLKACDPWCVVLRKAYICTTHQTCLDVAFSHDGKLLAMACQDGFTRVFNFEATRYACCCCCCCCFLCPFKLTLRLNNSLLYSLRSYFGAFRCVAWTLDGKYLIVRSPCKNTPIYVSLTSLDWWRGRLCYSVHYS